MTLDVWVGAQGLETYFNMHKYTKLLTFLTKIRISEYKYIQGIELHEVSLHTDLVQTVISHKVFNIFSKCKALAEAK